MKHQSTFSWILYIPLIPLFFSSCSETIKTEREFQDSTKIQKVHNFHELNIVYQNGKFFLLNNFRTQLDIYDGNELDSTIKLVQIKETYSGFEIKGQYVLSTEPYNEEHLIIVKTFPNEFHLLTINPPHKIKKLIIDIPSTEFLVEVKSLNNEYIIFNTYGAEALNQAKIYKYNIKNQTSTLIYEEFLKNPVAEFMKLKVDSQNLTILDPYHKVINILAHNGKLLSKQNFTTPPDFNYNFTENTRYESAEEFSKSEIDLEEFTRVIDFTIQENSLFLIVTQISGRKIIDRLIVRCGMDENFEPKIITSSFVPLHFDSNNNLFRYIEKDGQQFVEVVPIKNAIN